MWFTSMLGAAYCITGGLPACMVRPSYNRKLYTKAVVQPSIGTASSKSYVKKATNYWYELNRSRASVPC